MLGGKVSEFDLEGLLVLLAHIGDASLVCVHAIAGEVSEEGAKGLLDVLDDFLLLDPLGEGLFGLTVLVNVGHVAQAVVVFNFFSTAHHSCMDPASVFFSRKLFIVDKGSGCTCFVGVAGPVMLVEFALGSHSFADLHPAVVVVVHALVLIPVEFIDLFVVAENEPKFIEFGKQKIILKIK